MTNDQPIRFRTFADEDDNAWRGRDEGGAAGTADYSRFEPGNPRLGAAFPPPEPRSRAGAYLGWGTVLALVAGVALAVTLLPKPGSSSAGVQASNATLHVHRYVAAQPGGLASSALLPCYVDGAAVGSLTLTDCGRRNGVASGRLDVGLTPSPSSDQVVASAPPPTIARARAAPDESAGPTIVRTPSPFLAQTARPGPAPFKDGARILPSPPPRTLYAAEARPRYADSDGDGGNERPINREDSVRAAQTFYEGLADADGARAASVVVPEKRRQGPLSAGEIDRFYSGLQAPLRLTRLYPIDDHTVVARYAFVDRDGEVCNGTARVTTTERDGEVYVQGVRALSGC